MKRISKSDNNSFAPYKYNKDVEEIVRQAQLGYIQSLLDEALEKKLWITDKDEFDKILELHSKYFD